MRAVPQQYEASGYKRGMKRLIRGWAIPILVSIRSYTFYVFADFLPDGRSIRVGSTAGGGHSPNYPPRPTLRLPVGSDGLYDGARWRHGLPIVTVFVVRALLALVSFVSPRAWDRWSCHLCSCTQQRMSLLRGCAVVVAASAPVSQACKCCRTGTRNAHGRGSRHRGMLSVPLPQASRVSIVAWIVVAGGTGGDGGGYGKR